MSFEEIQFWFFFCVADGSAVKTEVFTRQLKGALAFCDLDCFSYKSHSFRISAASLAAENGMSDAQIRDLVVGNQMDLSYTYDRQPRGQIRFVFSVIAVMGW